MPHIRALHVEQRDDSLILDAASRRNLELTMNFSGGTEHTLASILDATHTAMGSRLLKRWLNRPLRDRSILSSRQQAVATFLKDQTYASVQTCLQRMADLERILSRVALKTARPRDLVALRDVLARLPLIQSELAYCQSDRINALRR